MMESNSLLEDLRSLPVGDDAAGYTHGTAVSKLRGTNKDTFALEVAQATEEALEALFEARNVPDVLEQAYRMAYTRESQSRSLFDHFSEMKERGEESVGGFLNPLKGKVAEIESVHLMEERIPGSSFEVVQNPIQQGFDLIGRGPEGTEEVLIQVKSGKLSYAGDVMQRMEDTPPNIDFAFRPPNCLRR